MTITKWRISGQGYKHLTSFSWYPLFKPVDSTLQKINPVGCFNLCRWRFCLYTFISCYLKKIIKIGFPELEKKFLQQFRSFFVKWLFKCWSLAVPNGLRIEHLRDIISKAQSWLVLNLPVLMFVYIHFNVPPTRILVRKCIRWKDLLIWNIHFVCWYVFACINLVCVQSVIQLMNTLFITFVLL